MFLFRVMSTRSALLSAVDSVSRSAALSHCPTPHTHYRLVYVCVHALFVWRERVKEVRCDDSMTSSTFIFHLLLVNANHAVFWNLFSNIFCVKN